MISILLILLINVFNAQLFYDCKNPMQYMYDNNKTYYFDYYADLNDAEVDSYWTCNLRSAPNFQKSQYYYISFSKDTYVEASVSFPETDFNAKIVVFNTCDTSYEPSKASGCVSVNEKDESHENQNARVTFNALAGKKYYVMVTGATAADVGKYRLVITEKHDYKNYKIENALEVVVPSTFDGNTQMAPLYEQPFSDGQLVRTVWYKFKGEGTPLYIDSCNSYTFIDTVFHIYRYENSDKTNLILYAEDNNGCGHGGSRIEKTFEQGVDYYLAVNSYYGENLQGQFQVDIRKVANRNSDCLGATGIKSTPFTVTQDMRTYSRNTSSCFSKELYDMWFSFQGDGQKYLLSTCGSYYYENGGYDTSLEVHSGCSNTDTKECLTREDNTCGNDAYFTKIFETGKTYYIRAACAVADCVINFKMELYDNITNSQCIKPKNTGVDSSNTFFSQKVNPNTFEISRSGCDSIPNQYKGAWYLFVGHLSEQTIIIANVEAAVPTLYEAYMEVHHDCKTFICDERSTGKTMKFVVPSMNDNIPARVVFATAILREGAEADREFGEFRFWASYSNDTSGYTPKTAIEITTLPFTSVHYIPPNNVYTSICHDGQKLNALWFKVRAELGKAFVASSCGPETQLNSALELLDINVGENNYTCVQKNTDDGCGGGATIGYNLTKGTDKDMYVVATHHPDELDVYGTVRLGVWYIGKVDEQSSCDKPQEVTSSYEGYIQIINSKQSIGNCNGAQSSVRGHWFRVTPSEEAYEWVLSVETDDISEVSTQIGIYPGCEVIDDVSHPHLCLDGGNAKTAPKGMRGTHITYTMHKNDTVFLFIGGMTSTSDGIIHAKINLIKTQTPEPNSSSNNNNKDDDDGPHFKLLGLTGWLIFGLAFIGFGIICGVLFLIMMWRKRVAATNYSTL